MMKIDLKAIYEHALDDERDQASGRPSEAGEDAAEIAALGQMCSELGVVAPTPGAWTADAGIQQWLRDNGQDYIEFCCEQAGVSIANCSIWMQAAGTLRLLKVI